MKTTFSLILLFTTGVLARNLNVSSIESSRAFIDPKIKVIRIRESDFENVLDNEISLRPLEEIVANDIVLLSDDDLKTVDDVFDITNDILDVGAAFEPLEKIFEPLAALGKLILACFHIGRRSDPVMDKLKDIQHQIGLLGQQMTQQFNEMKEFITEHSFDEDIVQTASTLHKFMQDTIAFPGNESISMFYREYERNPPIELGYKLASLLEQSSTNPLRQAMNADQLKTASTFNKWSKTLLNVMFHFLYIETYANGMFNNSTLYGPHRLEDRLKELNTTILGWERDYKNSYWPSVVENWIHYVQDNYIHETNAQKAYRIQNGIEQILQDENFLYFVVVYDPVNGYRRHGYGGTDIIGSLRRQKCNAVVMRTSKSRVPNYGVDRALEEMTVLKRHKKGKDNNRCLKMLQDADTYNPSASANLFIVNGNPAIYTGGYVSPGRTAFGWHTHWISTY